MSLIEFDSLVLEHISSSDDDIEIFEVQLGIIQSISNSASGIFRLSCKDVQIVITS